MKIFISHRNIDKEEVKKFLGEISNEYGFEFINHSIIEDSDIIWQRKVTEKIRDSKLVLFFIGSKSKNSVPVNWEFNETVRQKKKYKIIKLSNPELPKYFKKEKGIIENSSTELTQTLLKMELKSNPELLKEQYKIMVLSTEKVTEQRLKVNNLFFTVTTSLLSISALVGKLIGFKNDNTALLSVSIMLFFCLIAFVISFFWEKLIKSYGTLNNGKFRLITEIEHQLETNLFQREWEILQNDVGYKSNSETETNVVKGFRIFIIIIGVIEIVYAINLLCKIY
jgi:hypothetical protein